MCIIKIHTLTVLSFKRSLFDIHSLLTGSTHMYYQLLLYEKCYLNYINHNILIMLRQTYIHILRRNTSLFPLLSFAKWHAQTKAWKKHTLNLKLIWTIHHGNEYYTYFYNLKYIHHVTEIKKLIDKAINQNCRKLPTLYIRIYQKAKIIYVKDKVYTKHKI